MDEDHILHPLHPYNPLKRNEDTYISALHSLETSEPRERSPSILTYAQREYLLGKKDLEKPSENQLRQRMRDRVRSGLLDAELLFELAGERDKRTIFREMSEPPWPDESERDEIYKGTELMLTFLYYCVRKFTTADFESLLEKSIKRGATRDPRRDDEGYPMSPNVSVNISIDWEQGADVYRGLDKLRNEEPLSYEEIGAIVKSGHMTEDDWDLLRDKDGYDTPDTDNIDHS